MINTIRTKNASQDYFNNNWTKFFKKLNCVGYLGHLHITRDMGQFRLIGSAGYDGYWTFINDVEGKILLVADLHLGLEETKEHFIKDILPELRSNDYAKVIFLGDTFEMALCSDEEIRFQDRFWDWLKKTDKEVIFIIGNHDINLLSPSNSIRVWATVFNPTIKFARTYQIKSMCFAHGDMYDQYVKQYGMLYFTIFGICDYTGRFGKYIWSKISKYVR